MALTDQELTDLALLEPRLWRLLARGVFDKRHAFRLCSVATVSPDGWPQSRMVVLRDCDRALRQLSLHSDGRAGKVADLKANPAVTLLFWDKKASLQLRVRGLARLHQGNPEAQGRRQQMSAREAALYGYPSSPGEPLQAPPEVALNPPDEVLIDAHFCWIDVAVRELEMLHLGSPHTRAVFTYGESGGQLCQSRFLRA